MVIKRSVNFKELTTIFVGSNKVQASFVSCRQELLDFLYNYPKEKLADLVVLGGGSNVLSNGDFTKSFAEVLVIKNLNSTEIKLQQPRTGLTQKHQNNSNFTVFAGDMLDAVVEQCNKLGLDDWCALSGIPGTVGGAVVGNAGAYGRQISDFFIKALVYDCQEQKVIELKYDELKFAYRFSALKQFKNRFIVIECELGTKCLNTLLNHNEPRLVAQKQTRQEILQIRRGKGMVVCDDDPDSISCGSFFTNPIISASHVNRLPDTVVKYPLNTPLEDNVCDSASNNQYKISAASLIEHAGITRGFSLPGSKAKISTKHCLAITNPTKQASYDDIIQLANYIKLKVKEQFNIELTPEPLII